MLKKAKSPGSRSASAGDDRRVPCLQVNQRPTFRLENSIGDRAVFSGIVKVEPIAAAIEALLSDAAAYKSWKAHFSDPPAG